MCWFCQVLDINLLGLAKWLQVLKPIISVLYPNLLRRFRNEGGGQAIGKMWPQRDWWSDLGHINHFLIICFEIHSVLRHGFELSHGVVLCNSACDLRKPTSHKIKLTLASHLFSICGKKKRNSSRFTVAIQDKSISSIKSVKSALFLKKINKPKT